MGYLSAPLFLFGLTLIPFWWSLALLLPSNVDAITQGLGWRKSRNWLRFLTGLMAGTAIMSLISMAGRWTGQLILNAFS